MRFAVEIVRRIREAGRARTSSSSTACRCSNWSRAAPPGTRSCCRRKAIEAAGATIINTGIGWHEARVPTIATSVPRAAFAGVTAKLKAARARCRWSPPTASTCRRWPSASWPPATPTWCRWRGRCWPIRSWVDKARAGRARRDQHLHRLQPGLPGPRLREQERQLPGQSARLRRDRADLPPATAPQAHRRGRRRPGRPGLRDRRGRSAATRSRCSKPPTEIGGQFNLAKQHPGQGRVRRDAALLRRAAARCTASNCAWARASTPTRCSPAASTRSCWPPASRPRQVDFPGADHAEGLQLRRRASPAGVQVGARVALVGAGGIGFDVAEFLVQPAPSPTVDPARWMREWGVRPRLRRPGRPGQAAARSRRRGRSGCCSAARASPARSWARPPAGSTARR